MARGRAVPISLLLALSTATVARAQPAHSETPDALKPARARAHAELEGGLILAALSVGLAALGGGLAGALDDLGGDGGDRIWRAGLGVGVIGAALVLPAIELSVYAAGHRSGLRFRPEIPDAATRALQLDRAERAAHREEIAGIVTLSAGAVFAGAGAGMAVAGLGPINFGGSGQQGSGNGALFAGGIVLAVLGDAAFLTGMILWPHAAGLKKGLRESRRALRLTSTGVAAAF